MPIPNDSSRRTGTGMAQRVEVVLTDDLDGSVATHTVRFAVNGDNFEIDLNDTHAAEFQAALVPYLSHGRKIADKPSGKRRSRGGKSAAARADLTMDESPEVVRAWAKANGMDVSERGRIKNEVFEAFRAAQQGRPVAPA